MQFGCSYGTLFCSRITSTLASEKKFSEVHETISATHDSHGLSAMEMAKFLDRHHTNITPILRENLTNVEFKEFLLYKTVSDLFLLLIIPHNYICNQSTQKYKLYICLHRVQQIRSENLYQHCINGRPLQWNKAKIGTCESTVEGRILGEIYIQWWTK